MRRLLLLTCLGLLLSFAPTEVLAGIYDIDNPLDRSRYYLGLIFGSNIATVTLGGQANQILPLMFEVFNTIVVSVGVAVISYIGLVSTVNTANEGQLLGQKISTAWTPIKIILGLILMAPTPGSGYSMIQATVMWIVLQGAGAANEIWNIVLDNLSKGTSTTSVSDGSEFKPLENKAKEIGEQILYMRVCEYALKEFNRNDRNINWPNETPSPLGIQEKSNFVRDYGNLMNDYKEKVPSRPSGARPSESNITEYVWKDAYTIGYDNTDGNLYSHRTACGKVEVEVFANQENSGKTSVSDLREAAFTRNNKVMSAVITLFNYFDPIAQKIVKGSITKNSAANKSDNATSSAISIKKFAIDAYVNAVSELSNPITNEDDIRKIEQAKKDGWIHAGSLYFVLSQSGAINFTSDVESGTPTANTIPQPGTNELERDKDSQYSVQNNEFLDGQLSNYERRDLDYFLRTAQILYNVDEEDPAAVGMIDLNTENCQTQVIDGEEQQICSKSDAATTGAIGKLIDPEPFKDPLIKAFQVSGDPIQSMKSIGDKLMKTVETIWLVSGLAVFLMMLPAGTCHLFNPTAHGMRTMMVAMGMVVVTIMGALWSLGAMLAIYIPMIPFMMFTIAALGWMVSVIEALIAAPVIALGVLLPSGDELGKATQGITLLTGVFLRPSLMIIGFLLAAKLLAVVASMINFSMSEVLFNTTGGTGGLVLPGLVLKTAIYVIVMMAITNKCFSLIHILPDKILRWIGGAAAQTFGENILGETQQGFQSASLGAAGVITGSANAATQSVQKKYSDGQEEGEKEIQNTNAANKAIRNHLGANGKDGSEGSAGGSGSAGGGGGTGSGSGSSPDDDSSGASGSGGSGSSGAGGGTGSSKVGGETRVADSDGDGASDAAEALPATSAARDGSLPASAPDRSSDAEGEVGEEGSGAEGAQEESGSNEEGVAAASLGGNKSDSGPKLREKASDYDVVSGDKGERTQKEQAFYQEAVAAIQSATTMEEFQSIRKTMVGKKGHFIFNKKASDNALRKEALFNAAALQVARSGVGDQRGGLGSAPPAPAPTAAAPAPSAPPPAPPAPAPAPSTPPAPPPAPPAPPPAPPPPAPAPAPPAADSLPSEVPRATPSTPDKGSTPFSYAPTHVLKDAFAKRAGGNSPEGEGSEE